MTESTELQKIEPKAELVTGERVAPIIPRTVEEVFRVAQAVLRAGLAPDSYDNDAQKIVVGIMKGAEVGLPPITALSTIAIINKRPCIWGDGAVALVQASGELESMREWFDGTEPEDDWTAHCEMKRRGQDEVYKGSFSVKDAKRAKLWGNPKRPPWMLYPQRMLTMRARSWVIRNAFADCLSGLSIAEEIRDLPAAPEHIDKGFLEDAPAEGAPQIEETPLNGPPAAPEAGTERTKLQRTIEASLRACISVENLDAFWASQDGGNQDAILRLIYENLRAILVDKENQSGKPEESDAPLLMS